MIENGIEMILVRTIGGPCPGNRFVPITKISPNGQWPPLDELPSPEGKYIKTTQSNLPTEAAPHSHIARGVTYQWKSNERLPPS